MLRLQAFKFELMPDGRLKDEHKALNKLSKGGGVVCLPAGKYLVKGSLTILPGVSLKGVNQAPQFDPPSKYFPSGIRLTVSVTFETPLRSAAVPQMRAAFEHTVVHPAEL